MNKIANLTQHNATEEQVAAGVFDLVGEDRKMLVKLLTFATLPTKEEIEERAKAIAMLVMGCRAAMIGGAPYLMPARSEERRVGKSVDLRGRGTSVKVKR